MAGNYARLGVGVKDEASGPLDRIKGKFTALQQQGSKGFAIGAGAAITAKGLNLIGSAADNVGQAIGEAIQDASNLNEAMTKSEAVFKGSADEVEDWAGTASRAFGQSKRSALEAAGTFGNLIQAFGIGEDKAASMSKTLVELASDLASFNNTSVDEAIQALRSGLSGETEPLKRYGVALNDVRLKEEALRMGLIETTKGVLPITIKTQAAYALILKDTALAQGDFERTSEGMANQMKTLAAQAEDTSAKFGEVLLPVVMEFQSVVIKALDRTGIAFEDLEEAAAKGSQSAAGEMRIFQGIAEELGVSVETAFKLAAESGTKDIATLRNALNGYGGEMRDDMYRVETAAGDMGDGIEDGAETGEEAVESLADVMSDAADRMISEFFDPIETRADIYQEQQEQNAAEERRRDADTKREKREAADDIVKSIRRQADALVDLGEQGELTEADVDRFEKNVKQSYAALGKRVPKEIAEIIAALRRLDRWDGHSVSVNVRAPGIYTGPQSSGKVHRAGGGPASGLTRVGEYGPEDVVLPPGSFVRNAQETARMGGGGGGGNTFYITFTGNLADSKDQVLAQVQRMQAIAADYANG